MKTSEDNIKEYIEQRIEKSSLSEIFFELKKEVDDCIKNKKNTDLYSMEHNYTPIFLYYSIESQCSLEEFAKILQMSANYEDGLNRFFSYADCSYDEKDGSNIYDKMSYLFYKKENNKIIFNEDKIVYIKEIIKNVRPQNLLNFHSSRIDGFLAHVIINNKTIAKELMDLISQTPSMLKEEFKNYSSMPMSIMRIFADSSYEKDVSSIYNLFKENNVFKDLMFKNIIKLDFEGRYKTNLSFYQMISKNEENYFDIMMKKVNELKAILDNKKYIELIQDISYSIEDGVRKNPFQLSLEKINIENPIADNIPYLIALEKIIESGSYNLITGKSDKLTSCLNNYKEIINTYDYKDNQISYDEYFLIKKIDFNTIEKFFHYQTLDSKFKNKEIKLIKNKI